MELLLNADVWVNKLDYDKAELAYYEKLAKEALRTPTHKKASLAGEVAKAREHIKQSLENVDDIKKPKLPTDNPDLGNRLGSIEETISVIQEGLKRLEDRFASLSAEVVRLSGLVKITEKTATSVSSTTQESAPTKNDDDDDDVDLFGSGSEGEDEEAEKIKQKRVAEYTAKKSKKDATKSPILPRSRLPFTKPALIAKSNIILDVKPWDDETNMEEMQKAVREIKMDGLLWGASKLVPLAFGIHKLQISCVVEDDLVSVDELQERIEAIEDYVQSVDIAAFNKV